MDLDPDAYELALAQARKDAGLNLASPVFGAYAGSGGGTKAPGQEDPDSRSAKLKKANTKTATANATGSGAFEESAHPRGPGGEFIEKGDSGAAVRGAQQELGVKVDGDFGKQTTKKLRAFQKENDLQVDGVIGQQTAAALLGNDNADDIAPGALRPGQYKKLVSVLNKKKK